MFGSGASKIPPHFDVSLNPIPMALKPALDFVTKSFYNSRMRNLDLFYNNDGRKLYGLMTNYEGNNFCWIQPTRVKNKTADHEYDQYIRKINSKYTILTPVYDVKVGMDCVALYEADSHWYRGVVVSEASEDRWLVLFIDYGNFQICPKQQIMAPLNDPRCDHFHAPMQAVCCRLYNIVPKSSSLQEEVDKSMERFFVENCNNFLEVIVKNIRQDYVVDCDIFLSKSGVKGLDRFRGQHIGQALVDAGIATFLDPVAAHATGVSMPQEIIDLTDSD